MNENNKDSLGLYNSFKKHGVENHKFEVIEECELQNLNDRERYWQDYYDVIKMGLNCKLTTSNSKSGYLSKETKIKISKSKKGVKMSEETVFKIKLRMNTNHPMAGRFHTKESKIKMSKAHKGSFMREDSKRKRKETIKNRCPVYDLLCRTNLSYSLKNIKRTDSWRLNISNSLKGKVVSDEVKNKISKTLKGKLVGSLNGNSKMVLDLESGFFFDSITEFMKSKKCSHNHYNKYYKDKTTFSFRHKDKSINYHPVYLEDLADE